MIEVQPVQLEAFGSHGVTINHPIDPARHQTQPAFLRSGGPAHVVTALLEPGGKIGRHPATRPQLLMVVSGNVRITGDGGQALELCAGHAVLFERGEQHESVASNAVTLAIMEYDIRRRARAFKMAVASTGWNETRATPGDHRCPVTDPLPERDGVASPVRRV